MLDPSSPAATLYRRVTAAPEEIAALRRTLTSWALDIGLTAEVADDVALAAYEAMANVVAHAYPGHPGTLDLHASVAGGVATVVVSDRGRWVPPPPSRGPLGGRGLPLIRALSSRVAITPTPHGTTVRMAWHLW